MNHIMGNMRLGGMAIRYSQFVPKLYNYCISLGFEPGRIMPSRAFCSDENQGYPVILLTRHFGTFPFDHGVVGGRVATDRHGPYAHHGEDLVIVQASHVGYVPEQRRFGVYQRLRTAHNELGACCGKLAGVLDWYKRKYDHAGNDVQLGSIKGTPAVFIDNALLDSHRAEGLFLHLDRLIDVTEPAPLRVMSTSKAFKASPWLQAALGDSNWQDARQPIGRKLDAGMFFFRREPVPSTEGPDLLEEAIAPAMPALVTSAHPMLDAARYHTQIEFDRTYRTLQHDPAFEGKNLLFVSGLNVDVSPRQGLLFPLTKFVPWAAYGRLRNGKDFLLEQDELFAMLAAQSTANGNEIEFDAAIQIMSNEEGMELPSL